MGKLGSAAAAALEGLDRAAVAAGADGIPAAERLHEGLRELAGGGVFGGDAHHLRVVDGETEEHHAGVAGRRLRTGAEGLEGDRLQGDAVLGGLQLGKPGLQPGDFGGMILGRRLLRLDGW